MTDPQPYTYTILRYIHDMRNGEFINVGIVAYMPASSGSLESHKARLVFRIDEHHDRALCVFPDLHIEAYRLAIQSVTRTLDDQARRIEVGITPDYHNVMAIAYRAHPADDSGLRWSPVASGVSDDLTKALDIIYAMKLAPAKFIQRVCVTAGETNVLNADSKEIHL